MKGYSFDALPKLGIVKTCCLTVAKMRMVPLFLRTDFLVSDAMATFSLNIGGDKYKGTYKGLAVIAADKNSGLKIYGCRFYRTQPQWKSNPVV